mgnify:CR=1
MRLLTLRLILREFRETDFDLFCELEAHPETYRYETTSPSDGRTRLYLQKAQQDALQSPRTRYRFAVTIQPCDDVRGRVTLALLNDSIREWEIGWAIHPQDWGKGIATEAAQRLLEFAFAELQAHRVVAFSHAENAASLRIMEKLGMQQDGRLRETRLWKDQWSDEVVYSILDREWSILHTKD